MELLPPVGWADVATKRDLDHLADVLGARIDAVNEQLDQARTSIEARVDRSDLESAARTNELRAEMYREQRNQTLAIVGANTTITALLLAAFQLL